MSFYFTSSNHQFKRVYVWLKVSPQICVSPRNESVPEGYRANFSCKAAGVPKPTLSWTFNDGDLPSAVNQTILGEESFLELPHTTKQMEGIYKCTAENKANTTTSSAYLLVFGTQKLKTGSAQSSSSMCKNYLLKIYSQHGNFLKAFSNIAP